MGNTKFYRAISLTLLGFLTIGAVLAVDAHADTGCSSEIQKTADGAYSGCRVKMGNREFVVGAAQSSAEGCSQVCGIMAEMGGRGPAAKTSAATVSNTHRE